MDPSATLMAGMEATGHHYENLFAFLTVRSDPARTILVLLNLLATNAYACSELLVAKTDAVDSALIARYLLRHQPAASPPTEAERIELRRLPRSRGTVPL